MLTYLNPFCETKSFIICLFWISKEKEFYINKFHLNFKDGYILDGFREDDKF